METKRYALYIIRVQTGANLTEILCKPVMPQDEDRWDALVREELADLACEPVALLRRVGAAPLVLYGDCERRPVEEAVPDSEVEFVLQFR